MGSMGEGWLIDLALEGEQLVEKLPQAAIL